MQLSGFGRCSRPLPNTHNFYFDKFSILLLINSHNHYHIWNLLNTKVEFNEDQDRVVTPKATPDPIFKDLLCQFQDNIFTQVVLCNSFLDNYFRKSRQNFRVYWKLNCQSNFWFHEPDDTSQEQILYCSHAVLSCLIVEGRLLVGMSW